MGEVVLSSEDLDHSETEKENKTKTSSSEKEVVERDGTSSGTVRWERLLPKMVLRVLLVEADDSTRQIIAALLRKCSYRVAAVPDGLKAWEILKGSSHNIDLILTEVDLPAISGFALLTLIMEHEICKNIPVIMMSSHDSVSTVYKCMLRGAADYLVKPIRRNELRNLWQHVWRRQSSTIIGNSPQDESVAQQKVEGTSENNFASNHSSGYMACVQPNEEHVEKGSDAQSSCTKPDWEAERNDMENMQDFSRPTCGKISKNDVKRQKNEVHINSGQRLQMHDMETGGYLVGGACKDASMTNVDNNVEPDSQRTNANSPGEAGDNDNVLISHSREAIDFMGAFHSHIFSSNNASSELDSSPNLVLSLRRSHPGRFENQVAVEKHILRQSNASAFTRYINRPLRSPQPPSIGDCRQGDDLGTNYEKRSSDTVTCYNSDAATPSLSTRGIISLTTDQSKQSEIATACSTQRVFPVPVPVKGIRLNSGCTLYGSVLSSFFGTPSGPSQTPCPSSASQQESMLRVNPFHQSNFQNNNSEHLCNRLGQNANNSTNQTLQKHDLKSDSLEDQAHISPATDQSATSSFCNGTVSHLNSVGYGSTCGSNSNVDQVTVVRESKNEDGSFTRNGNCHRSIQREVALTKFRMKRKDRCYEKKVRYESRKKLAEQRPRVKGQFVRQVNTDILPAETENNHG